MSLRAFSFSLSLSSSRSASTSTSTFLREGGRLQSGFQRGRSLALVHGAPRAHVGGPAYCRKLVGGLPAQRRSLHRGASRGRAVRPPPGRDRRGRPAGRRKAPRDPAPRALEGGRTHRGEGRRRRQTDHTPEGRLKWNPTNPARTRPSEKAGSYGPDPATRPLRGGPGGPGVRCPRRNRTRPGLGAGLRQLPLPIDGERRLGIDTLAAMYRRDVGAGSVARRRRRS